MAKKPALKKAPAKAKAKPESKSKTKIKPAHLWKPGQSGNPGGRPKVVAEVRELARAHTEDALATLASIMKNEDAPPAARVSAAAHILDRGYGKPQQSIVSTIRDVRQLSDDELLAYLVETDGGDGAIEEASASGLPH